jgi:nitrite reductase (NAD(P)H)
VQDIGTVIMSSNLQPQVPVEEIKLGPIEGWPGSVKGSENEGHGGQRKKVVIVGLGMVGISFM